VSTRPTQPAFPVGRVLAAYRGMLPWMLLLWLVAAVLPGPGGAEFLVVIGLSPFVVAAAASGMGLHPDRTVAALAVERAFTHLTSLLPLLLFVALAVAIGGTLGAMIAEGLGLADPRLTSVPLAALVALPILWWHWPAAVLAYVAPEGAGYRRPGGRTWRGPRYSDARTLSRLAGAPHRTALVLAFLCLWIVTLAMTHDYRGDMPLALLVQAASYLAFLPLLVAMGAVEVRRMVVSAAES
jgi:hypothetical protein